MTQRGLTLIELMIALSLCSMLTVAAASWMLTASRTCVEQSQISRWQTAAQAVFALIQHDLAVGDFPPADQADSAALRIEIGDASLRIQTRVNGAPGTRMYEFNPASGEILSHGHGESETRTRLLLQMAERWHCAYDEHLKSLSVSIEGPRGISLHREIPIP